MSLAIRHTMNLKGREREEGKTGREREEEKGRGEREKKEGGIGVY